MTIRVLVNGAKGKMGQTTVNALSRHPDFTLAGQTDQEDDLAKAIRKNKATVVVDFTNADAGYKNTLTILEAGAHPVIGTTGFLPDHIKEIQTQCDTLKRGAIIAPNFSLGAVLMMKYAEEIARYFPQVEIIEMHHDGKLDSPSGTALRTAEKIASARKVKQEKKATRDIIPHARGASYHDIPIHAVRLPGLVAHQQVIFGDTGETLTLRHDSIARECFMPGVILACQKVMQLDHLVYGLEHLL